MTRYVITLEPMPGDVPEVVRLRRLLKIAGRALGLRCVAVVQEPERRAGELLREVKGAKNQHDARARTAGDTSRTAAARSAALEQCQMVDECKSWADKAKALASYAAQSADDSLYKMAIRIRSRAIRRAGELLREVLAQPGARTDKPRTATNKPRTATDTRSAVARRAGLSKRQKDTALRVARVPKDNSRRRWSRTSRQAYRSQAARAVPGLPAARTCTDAMIRRRGGGLSGRDRAWREIA